MMQWERQGKKTLATEARHQVAIERNAATTDGEGGYSDGIWQTIDTVFAAIYPIQARQQFQYKSIGVDATHLIKIRGKIEVAETDRIKFGSRVFEILAVENIQERGFEKVITCKEARDATA
jgi:SPP1 family predicted phage head-tail adaptor